MNGKIDCADSACSSDPACQSTDGGNYGPCMKCGQACSKQQDCFGMNLLDDRPLAQCKNGRCQQLNEAVQLRIEYNTASWGGVSASVLGAITTRWISKIAADGGAVTCDAVKAAAPANDLPLQVEASGRFFTMGLDVTRYNMGGSIPNPLTVPFAYTGSGSDYLIYTEAWAGAVDPGTRLPTGARRDAGCVVSGSEVAPVTPDQDCKPDGGTTCRTLRIPLPGP